MGSNPIRNTFSLFFDGSSGKISRASALGKLWSGMFASIRAQFIESDSEKLQRIRKDFEEASGHTEERQAELLIVNESFHAARCGDQTPVLHHWIEDSLKIGKLLPFHFYTAPVGKPFDRIQLCFDISSEFEKDVIAEMTQAVLDAGATIVEEDGDWTVSQFVDDPLTRFDKRASPFWLLRVLSNGKYVDPHLALDFPCPVDPIEVPIKPVISLSGFSPAEREPLIAMITLAGAVYTPELSKENTHLVVASVGERSVKWGCAQENGIPIHDRYWLERSVFAWSWIE